MLNPEVVRNKKIETRITVFSPVGTFVSEVLEWVPSEWEQMLKLLDKINNLENFSFQQKGKKQNLHFGPELLKNSVIAVEKL